MKTNKIEDQRLQEEHEERADLTNRRLLDQKMHQQKSIMIIFKFNGNFKSYITIVRTLEEYLAFPF